MEDQFVSKKMFTFRQVFILIIAIVLAISFIESSSWKEFGLKVLLYGVISEFVIIKIKQIFKK